MKTISDELAQQCNSAPEKKFHVVITLPSEPGGNVLSGMGEVYDFPDDQPLSDFGMLTGLLTGAQILKLNIKRKFCRTVPPDS